MSIPQLIHKSKSFANTLSIFPIMHDKLCCGILKCFFNLQVVKTEVYSSLTYWHVFTPLFIVTALNLYFLFIVLVRAVVEEKQCKDPILKYNSSCFFFSFPVANSLFLNYVLRFANRLFKLLSRVKVMCDVIARWSYCSEGEVLFYLELILKSL